MGPTHLGGQLDPMSDNGPGRHKQQVGPLLAA
jgi:hypothetical protein